MRRADKPWPGPLSGVCRVNVVVLQASRPQSLPTNPATSWGTQMDTQMKIDAAVVKALREEKSWAQEHLASASGLSARTVQRVEAEGLGRQRPGWRWPRRSASRQPGLPLDPARKKRKSGTTAGKDSGVGSD